jgi:hypothetical protein
VSNSTLPLVKTNMTESTLLQWDAKRASNAQELSAASRAALGRLKFGPEDDFYRELRKRVKEFIKRTGRKQRDCPRMYAKTALILGWFAASYVLLVFFATAWWQSVPLAISLALSMVAIGSWRTRRFQCRKSTREEWLPLGRCTRFKPPSTTGAGTVCFPGLSAG